VFKGEARMKKCEDCGGFQYELCEMPRLSDFEELCRCLIPYRNVVSEAFGLHRKASIPFDMKEVPDKEI
jgi:hypothetical protein